MVTVSEQYKLEQENKRLKFVLKQGKKLCDTYENTIEEQNQKLEKVKELAKVYQREEWGDCRYIRKVICGKLKEILASHEKK